MSKALGYSDVAAAGEDASGPWRPPLATTQQFATASLLHSKPCYAANKVPGDQPATAAIVRRTAGRLVIIAQETGA